MRNKARPDKVHVALSVNDVHRMTLFVQVLVQIDRRVNPNKKAAPKKKETKETSITSITKKGSQFREPYFANLSFVALA